MTKFIKENYHYLLLFIFIFLTYTLFLFQHNYGDPISNYGFSYAIVKGLIPYKDFNIITTPLYAYIMSIGLFFWNNYTMFLLEQSLIVTIMFYLLNKIYGKKTYILLFVIACFSFLGINATYNFFTFFMMIILLFLENKYKDKDYLIGIVLGLIILSKHTVGIFFIIPSIIYYFKRKDKLLKRFTTTSIVIIIFTIYLILSNSLKQFIDLCLLGLIDFSSNNIHVYNKFFYTTIILFIISLIITIKRKDITDYYLLFSIAFVIPLFDICHFSIYVLCITLQILPYIKKYEKYIGIVAFTISILIAINNYYSMLKFSPVLNKDIKHFNYLYNTKYYYKALNKYFSTFDQYENAIILSYTKMQYDISRDNKIDYFDVPLYGNYGYNGSKKIIKEIEKKITTIIKKIVNLIKI